MFGDSSSPGRRKPEIAKLANNRNRRTHRQYLLFFSTGLMPRAISEIFRLVADPTTFDDGVLERGVFDLHQKRQVDRNNAKASHCYDS